MAEKEFIFLEGKMKWVKHITPDTAFEQSKWTICWYPTPEGIETLKALKKEGVQNHIKMDDDGTFMNFGRPTERTYKGKKVGLTPPKVVDKAGVPIETRIGNGSDGIIKLEVYKHKTGVPGQFKKAVRWEGLRVDNLVPFDADTDYPSDEEKVTVKSLTSQPEMLF